MSDRQLVVVDTETTGLHDDAAILEIAAVNVDTGEELHFVPWVTQEQLAKAQPDALRINRYYERGAYRDMVGPDVTRRKYDKLRDMLKGNTFGGSNPAFDSRLIARQTCNLRVWAQPVGTPWHHRLADLAAYAAGVLGIDPTDLPGLDAVASLLSVNDDVANVGERHSALGDARITAQCFRELRDWTPRNQAN